MWAKLCVPNICSGHNNDGLIYIGCGHDIVASDIVVLFFEDMPFVTLLLTQLSLWCSHNLHRLFRTTRGISARNEDKGDCTYKLKKLEVIPESTEFDIRQSKNKELANVRLLRHLKKDANEEAVREVFRFSWLWGDEHICYRHLHIRRSHLHTPTVFLGTLTSCGWLSIDYFLCPQYHSHAKSCEIFFSFISTLLFLMLLLTLSLTTPCGCHLRPFGKPTVIDHEQNHSDCQIEDTVWVVTVHEPLKWNKGGKEVVPPGMDITAQLASNQTQSLLFLET